MYKIKRINRENFKSFGWIIEYPRNKSYERRKNLFTEVIKEPGRVGWRIAYLIVRDKVITRLEKHPHAFESFEPVSGSSLLYLARVKEPGRIRCFYLDKPVVLKKGIWHGVLTLGKESEIKITENAEVECKYWQLSFIIDGKAKRLKKV